MKDNFTGHLTCCLSVSCQNLRSCFPVNNMHFSAISSKTNTLCTTRSCNWWFFSERNEIEASIFLFVTTIIKYCDSSLSFLLTLLLIQSIANNWAGRKLNIRRNQEKMLKISSWNQEIFYQEKSPKIRSILVKSGGLASLTISFP